MIEQVVLSNGMKVVLENRRTVPVVACWLRFGIGAADEPVRGITHFVEHMLFKGGGGLAVGEVATRFDGLGGDVNAYTTHDETVLHCVLPSRHVDLALRTLSQMSFEAAFDADEVERERHVILDEILEGQDDPGRLLGEALSRRIWTRHPYRFPILGSERSVRSVSRDTLFDWYRSWFTPANATLVVVGDVTWSSLEPMVRRWFGRSSPSPLIPRARRLVEPPQPGVRIAQVQRDFQEQSVEVAFRIPGQGDPGLPMLDLLVAALGQGASSMLTTRLRLVEGRVHGAWAHAEVIRDGGVLVLGFSPREGQLRQALGSLASLVEEVRVRGVSLDALQRARRSVLSDRIYQGETVEGRASTLCWLVTARGGPEAEGVYRDQVASAKSSDLTALARDTLDLERATVGLLGPEADLSQEAVETLLRRGGGSPRDRLATSRRVHTPGERLKVVRSTLSCGARVLVEPDPDAPLVGLKVVGLGGALLETTRTAGHSRAWSDLLTEGTQGMDALEYAEAVESLAGSVRGFSSRSTLGITAEMPADAFTTGLPLAILPLVEPRFSPDAVERIRLAMEEVRRTRDDDPEALAWEALWQSLMGGHPYRLPTEGTHGSIGRVQPRAIWDIHRRAVRGDNLVVGVAGPVEPERVFRILDRLLKPVDGSPFQLPERPPPVPRCRSRRVQGPFAQAHVLLGFPGCRAMDPDSAAMEVLGTLLGAQGGRLFLSLRERTALTYGTTASSLEGYDAGLFVCSLTTSPERVREAVKGMRDVIRDLDRRPPDEEEVARARESLAGATLLDLQRTSFRASYMAEDERLGLDGSRYRQNLAEVGTVRPAQVHEAARSRLSVDQAVVIRVVEGR